MSTFQNVETELQSMFLLLQLPTKGITTKYLEQIYRLQKYIQNQSIIHGAALINASASESAHQLHGSSLGAWECRETLLELNATIRYLSYHLNKLNGLPIIIPVPASLSIGAPLLIKLLR